MPDSFQEVGEEYWAVMNPPTKPAGTTYVDMELCLDGTICDSHDDALLYTDPGTIDSAVTQMNPAEPRTGTGVLVTIRFEAVAEGTSDVHLDSIQLQDDSNPEPVEIPADAEHGQVVVGTGQPIYLPLLMRNAGS